MKKLFTFVTLLLPLYTYAGDKSEVLFDDPDPRLPQRESSKSEDSELMLETGNATQQNIEGRQVKENMEEVDPIFYDATTSPAELDKAD